MNARSIDLPSVKAVTPFNADVEKKFLKEISAVLRKHKMLDRIGLCLLHKHYDIASNEILVETTDARERLSTIGPVTSDSMPNDDLLETMWKIEEDGSTRVVQYCGRCS